MFKQNELNQIALPLMFSNVFSLMIGLCDQVIIGHLSITSFALVGMIVSLVNSITGILGCITISFNIIGAKCFQHQKLFRQYVANQIILSLGLGILSWLFFYLFGEWIFGYIYQLEGEPLVESLKYIHLFSLSIGLNLLIFTGSSYLKIMNRTKYIFLASTISALSNILFDVIFIYVVGLGMIGNAIGSILAMILNLCIYIFLLRNERICDLSVFNLSLMIKLFRSSILFMIQELFEETILVLLLAVLISQIGLLELSVYQLINSLLQIAWMPMYAYAQAILTLGSKYPKKINNLNNQALVESMSLYCIIAIIIIYNQDFILSLITDEKNLVESCRVYLPIVFLISILNHLVVIYQYALKTMDLQLWVLRITVVIYVVFCLFIYIINQVYDSLIVIYLGLGVVYIVVSILLKYKLYSTIKNE